MLLIIKSLEIDQKNKEIKATAKIATARKTGVAAVLIFVIVSFESP